MAAAAGIPYLLMALLGATFFWGSLIAFRGRRWWATTLMLVGSGAQVLGALGMVLGIATMLGGFSASSSGGGSSAISSGLSVMIFVLMAGMIVVGIGFVLFAVGFVGFCSRYGPMERRAAELEGMVQGIQERMEEGQ